MQASQCNDYGIFECVIDLEADPEEPGRWLVPGGAYCIEPPKDLPAGYSAVITGNGSGWDFFENHLGREGYVNGCPHTVTKLGPLPEGWSDEPPAPDPIVFRREEILAELRRIDASTIRPERSIRVLESRSGLTAEERETLRQDYEVLSHLDQQARDLRTELHEVESRLPKT